MLAKEFAADYNRYLEHLEAHLNKNRQNCTKEMAARLQERIEDFKTFVAVLQKIDQDFDTKKPS